MTEGQAYPSIKKGHVLGWVIVFGVRGELRAFVPVDAGETKATQRASDLRGVHLTVVSDSDFEWESRNVSNV